jgi:hypothetical protein
MCRRPPEQSGRSMSRRRHSYRRSTMPSPARCDGHGGRGVAFPHLLAQGRTASTPLPAGSSSTQALACRTRSSRRSLDASPDLVADLFRAPKSELLVEGLRYARPYDRYDHERGARQLVSRRCGAQKPVRLARELTLRVDELPPTERARLRAALDEGRASSSWRVGLRSCGRGCSGRTPPAWWARKWRGRGCRRS